VYLQKLQNGQSNQEKRASFLKIAPFSAKDLDYSPSPEPPPYSMSNSKYKGKEKGLRNTQPFGFQMFF